MTVTPEAALADAELAARLRAGDETAFAGVIHAYGPALHRLARCYVPNAAAADEAVQETWLAVIDGIDRFEARSAVKTWIFGILRNIARHCRSPRCTSEFSSTGRACGCARPWSTTSSVTRDGRASPAYPGGVGSGDQAMDDRAVGLPNEAVGVVVATKLHPPPVLDLL